MKRSSLTARPRVPMLVRATAVGALALAPLGCGDDGTSGDSDVFPTDPCSHNPVPECGSSSPTNLTGTDSGASTGSGSTAADESGETDVAPTAGPCAHDPDLPECASTSDSGSGTMSGTTGTGTGDAGSSGSTGG